MSALCLFIGLQSFVCLCLACLAVYMPVRIKLLYNVQNKHSAVVSDLQARHKIEVRPTDGQTDRQTDSKQVDKQIDKQVDKQIDKQVDGQIDLQWTDRTKWADRHADKWTDR